MYVQSFWVLVPVLPYTSSHQLWSLPSALADILIAVAMTLLVRNIPYEFFNASTELLLYSYYERGVTKVDSLIS